MSNKRVRLTERARDRRAVDGSIPYPGNVNQPDRRFKDHAQYDNWEEVINHPTPDLRHEWQDNPRDEIGFGIAKTGGARPSVASVKVAADKAVRVAMLLLGDKTPDGVVEDQARDFIMMGSEALDRTIARFTETNSLYAADEEETDEEEVKEAKSKKAEDEEVKEDDKEEKAKEAKKASAVAIAKRALAKAASNLAALTAGDDSEEDDSEDDTTTASDELADGAGESTVLEQPAKEAKSASTAKKAGIQLEPVRGMNEMDIELQTSTDSEFAPDAEADALLASIFDDGRVSAELQQVGESRREASAKKGVTRLGGQPKVASSDGPADISNLWGFDAPDVSEIFN